MKTRTVVVTDGDQRAALAVVRSLGASGYRCIVATHTGPSLAGASRYVARECNVPSPLEAPDAMASAIGALVRAESATLLVPIAEPSLLALLPHRNALDPCVIPFPDLDVFRAISDKQMLLAAAPDVGIAVPEQRVITAANDPVDVDALAFPVVIKPSRSVGEAAGARAKLSVSYAGSAAELEEKLAALPAAAFPVLLQQRIVGSGIGIFVLIWNGELRAAFAHRRLTEKPPSGGVSVYRESAPMDADLLSRSLALLERFRWSGVAMVEYKRDANSGRPYLMEVNGRFWGSLQLAIDAGVDFPRLLAMAALNEPAAPVTTYRFGVRSRWSWGHVDHLIARVRKRGAPAPPGSPGPWRVFSDLVLGAFRPGDYDEVFRVSDPGPFWRESLRWIRRA